MRKRSVSRLLALVFLLCAVNVKTNSNLIKDEHVEQFSVFLYAPRHYQQNLNKRTELRKRDHEITPLPLLLPTGNVNKLASHQRSLNTDYPDHDPIKEAKKFKKAILRPTDDGQIEKKEVEGIMVVAEDKHDEVFVPKDLIRSTNEILTKIPDRLKRLKPLYKLGATRNLSSSSVKNKPVRRHVTGRLMHGMPFSFQYIIDDEETKNYQTRQEEGDTQGVVRGCYQVLEPTGLVKTVTYKADVTGFKVLSTTLNPDKIPCKAPEHTRSSSPFEKLFNRNLKGPPLVLNTDSGRHFFLSSITKDNLLQDNRTATDARVNRNDTRKLIRFLQENQNKRRPSTLEGVFDKAMESTPVALNIHNNRHTSELNFKEHAPSDESRIFHQELSKSRKENLDNIRPFHDMEYIKYPELTAFVLNTHNETHSPKLVFRKDGRLQENQAFYHQPSHSVSKNRGSQSKVFHHSGQYESNESENHRKHQNKLYHDSYQYDWNENQKSELQSKILHESGQYNLNENESHREYESKVYDSGRYDLSKNKNHHEHQSKILDDSDQYDTNLNESHREHRSKVLHDSDQYDSNGNKNNELQSKVPYDSGQYNSNVNKNYRGYQSRVFQDSNHYEVNGSKYNKLQSKALHNSGQFDLNVNKNYREDQSKVLHHSNQYDSTGKKNSKLPRKIPHDSGQYNINKNENHREYQSKFHDSDRHDSSKNKNHFEDQRKKILHDSGQYDKNLHENHCEHLNKVPPDSDQYDSNENKNSSLQNKVPQGLSHYGTFTPFQSVRASIDLASKINIHQLNAGFRPIFNLDKEFENNYEENSRTDVSQRNFHTSQKHVFKNDAVKSPDKGIVNYINSLSDMLMNTFKNITTYADMQRNSNFINFPFVLLPITSFLELRQRGFIDQEVQGFGAVILPMEEGKNLSALQSFESVPKHAMKIPNFPRSESRNVQNQVKRHS